MWVERIGGMDGWCGWIEWPMWVGEGREVWMEESLCITLSFYTELFAAHGTLFLKHPF